VSRDGLGALSAGTVEACPKPSQPEVIRYSGSRAHHLSVGPGRYEPDSGRLTTEDHPISAPESNAAQTVWLTPPTLEELPPAMIAGCSGQPHAIGALSGPESSAGAPEDSALD
jgi:hypothetical protein